MAIHLTILDLAMLAMLARQSPPNLHVPLVGVLETFEISPVNPGRARQMISGNLLPRGLQPLHYRLIPRSGRRSSNTAKRVLQGAPMTNLPRRHRRMKSSLLLPNHQRGLKHSLLAVAVHYCPPHLRPLLKLKAANCPQIEFMSVRTPSPLD
jgi:hypothetical protein